jgi:mono/diheme cytochrome c family protein
MKWILRTAMLLLGLGTAAVLGVLWLDRLPPVPTDARPRPDTPEQVARGAMLALAGNCAGCHTARGGVPYAGGRAIETPFGTVYGGNLTPDERTGIGRWSPEHFWRALHHGRGFDGRRLVPVFPYTEFTRVTRADSDALYAWLRTLPPVNQANRQHTLRWPYDTTLALAAWRVLFFRPGEWRPDTHQSAQWNRGAYLVNGLGHCSACHGGRNVLGAVPGAGFGGGLIPTRNWYAPSLTRADEAGVADWPLADIVALLQTGTSPRGVALGPMAEVVLRSTQHLPAAELQAMAVYLKSLPAEAARPRSAATEPPNAERIAGGAKLYETHCADCHGTAGEGGVTAEGRRLVPPLAGNRSVTMEPPANLVRAIALGGFGPATAGHPRPFGMPPFAQVLSDEQIGAVATFLRTSWGAQASAVSAFEVSRYRGGSGD